MQIRKQLAVRIIPASRIGTKNGEGIVGGGELVGAKTLTRLEPSRDRMK